jgi:NAD(P)-dependent dehydrogenase (short-subunit alcohol dehydrogenase family)
MTQRLLGRVAIVTGGGRGIGFHVARSLAVEGAHVMIADLGTRLDGTGRDESLASDAAATIQRDGGECAAMRTDVTDPGSVHQLIEATTDRYGSLDVVVNAAGNLRAGGLADMTADDLDATLRVHVCGTAHLMQAALQHWHVHPGSRRRVVNVSSESGLYGDGPYLAYGAAKAGVIALTLGSVDELAAVGATAHVFIPQAATRMTSSIPAALLPDAGTGKWLPGGEFDPRNVTPALVYLAGEDSDWLSGRIVGGWGYEVHLYSVPARARSLHRDQPWDLDALHARLPEAFGP